MDVGLILARNRSPDHYYRTLFNSLLTPICSPELLKGPNALKTPEDLKKHKLLYVYTAEEDWHLWLEEAGVKGIKLSDRLAFDSYILAQEAAIEGRGVAMTIGPFATEEIKMGRLVQPFPAEGSAPAQLALRLQCRAPHETQDQALRGLAGEADRRRPRPRTPIAKKESQPSDATSKPDTARRPRREGGGRRGGGGGRTPVPQLPRRKLKRPVPADGDRLGG